MRTLQIIETVRELADLFKEGKLEGNWVFCGILDDYRGETTVAIELRESDTYVLDKKLVFNEEEFINELLNTLGIPTEKPS